MNNQNTRATKPHIAMPRSVTMNVLHNPISRNLLASLGAAFIMAATSAQAATAPPLAASATYGILSSSYTNTAAGTTITGDLGYTTGPAVTPTVSGTTHVANGPYNTAGIDQGSALANLNSQSCTSLGAGAIALNAVDLGAGPGVFPPGCYSSGGAMNITTNTSVKLNGAGAYIFRSGGALTTGANSSIVTTGGVCESDVFWTPTGATTLGANTKFRGTIIDSAGITLGKSASLIGRALAFGGTVTTDTNTITVPTCTGFVPPITPVGATTSSKKFSPASITAGGVSRLTITLTNNNTSIATLSTAFIDTLPTGVVVASTPNAVTSCGGTVTAAAGSSTVSIPAGATIPSGAPGMCTISVDVTAAAAGSYVNSLPILSTDKAAAAAPSSVTLTVSATPIYAQGIPTLSEWAMIMLAALLAMVGFVTIRRQTA